jgi:hypothetical protein
LAAAIMATGGAVIGNAADLSVRSDFAEFANDVAGKIDPGSAECPLDLKGLLMDFLSPPLKVIKF